MQTEYKNLKELKEAIDSGKLDGAKLQIVLDNDETYYYYNDGSEDGKTISVESAGDGYHDYEELYQLYFPTSTVGNC